LYKKLKKSDQVDVEVRVNNQVLLEYYEG